MTRDLRSCCRRSSRSARAAAVRRWPAQLLHDDEREADPEQRAGCAQQLIPPRSATFSIRPRLHAHGRGDSTAYRPRPAAWRRYHPANRVQPGGLERRPAAGESVLPRVDVCKRPQSGVGPEQARARAVTAAGTAGVRTAMPDASVSPRARPRSFPRSAAVSPDDRPPAPAQSDTRKARTVRSSLQARNWRPEEPLRAEQVVAVFLRCRCRPPAPAFDRLVKRKGYSSSASVTPSVTRKPASSGPRSIDALS